MKYVGPKGVVVLAIQFKDDADTISQIGDVIFHDDVFSVDYSVSPPVLKHRDSTDQFDDIRAEPGSWLIRFPDGRKQARTDRVFKIDFRPLTNMDHRGVMLSISYPLLEDMLCREFGLVPGSLNLLNVHSEGWNHAAAFTLSGQIDEFPVVPEGQRFPQANPIFKQIVERTPEGNELISRHVVLEDWGVNYD